MSANRVLIGFDNIICHSISDHDTVVNPQDAASNLTDRFQIVRHYKAPFVWATF